MINAFCIRSVGNATLNGIQKSSIACRRNIFKYHNQRNYFEHKCFYSGSNDSNDFDLKELKTDTEQFLKYLRNCKQLESKYIPLRSKKERAEGYAKGHFVDHVEVVAAGGNGGDGCPLMARVYCNEFAGPDGGDGGNGGHVLFQATRNKTSLCHVPHKIQAGNGVKGKKKQCHGASSEPVVMPVPLGTVVKYEGKEIGSLDIEKAIFIGAKGGAGGKGNIYFADSENRAPEVAEQGGQGETFKYELELKTMADIGLVGFPNAGKSTLLRSISRARPKVASYPFTTLNPHVGVVQYADHFQLAVADIPGLIEDSHLNYGLGHDFLRHIQRCSGLLYVIDASRADPWRQLEVLRNELDQYDPGLSRRPFAVVANKVDLPETEANLQQFAAEIDMPMVVISAKFGTGVSHLLSLLRRICDRNKLDGIYRNVPGTKFEDRKDEDQYAPEESLL